MNVFSFSNNNTELYINEKGWKSLLMQYLQMNILEKRSTIDIVAETIDVLLDYHISRKIMFETIKGNPEYKEQMTKILSE